MRVTNLCGYSLRSISEPTSMKCAFDSINVKTLIFCDTIIKLIQTPNLEYKSLTAKVEHAA
jgi:hypothetical protein